MRRLKHSYATIAKDLGISERAVQYTVEKGVATPQHKNAGRPPKLSRDEVDDLVQFVTSSQANRRLTYLQLAECLYPEGEIGPESIKFALRSRGFRRRAAYRKPFISERNRVLRLAWAQERIYWTKEQWKTILWSDETWVTPHRHRKTFLTMRNDETLTPDCVLPKERRPKGWMFWGCFYGSNKGTGIFWEKSWGSIDAESYQEHICPTIIAYIDNYPSLRFMQDNAPGHKAASTRRLLEQAGVSIISWPAFSPDLNPIETVWNKLKDWLGQRYPDHKCSYEELRRRVQEAWEAIEEGLLQEIMDTMHQRCQDVIEANGMYTKW